MAHDTSSAALRQGGTSQCPRTPRKSSCTEPSFPAGPLLVSPTRPELAACLSAHSVLPGLLFCARGNKGLPRAVLGDVRLQTILSAHGSEH